MWLNAELRNRRRINWMENIANMPAFSKMVRFAPYKQIGIVFTLDNNNNNNTPACLRARTSNNRPPL